MSMIEVMTELDAVNEMLMSIGQAPVSTLSVSGIRDVNIARGELTKVSRRVQTRGWHFNTDDDYTLSPDIDGHIVIPAGALKVKGMSPSDNFTTRRHTKGLALYNRDGNTFAFAAPVSVRIVWGFGFDDLPETARAYIATAAGQKFQAQVIGSQILDAFEDRDVMAAWMLLEREERANRRTNLFRQNGQIAGFGSRRY